MIIFYLIVCIIGIIGILTGWNIGEWFWPKYICHICQDEHKKLGRFEYERYNGAHKACLQKLVMEAPLDELLGNETKDQ